uniref:Uncharacterized protein n=1 Tax=viral metagenome TaxID=1070528 RepID=A0A6C0BWC0_9ZZZZ
MENTPNNCKYCGKHYTRTQYLKRHELACLMKQQVTQKSKRVVDADAEEEEDVMPISVVSLIVKELVVKMAKMEEEIVMLKKWANKEKTRVNLVDWLTEHETAHQTATFVEWYKKTMIITRQHLELVFKYDIIQAIPYIFENLIGTETANIPIKCFEQKASVFYVFGAERTWVALSLQDFAKFVEHIHNKIIIENIKWQKENKHMLEDDAQYKEYLENNLKVLATKYDADYMCSQIRNKLFNYLKYNLNSVHEYEFVF